MLRQVIISDTSCLIVLSNIGELDLLHRLYGQVATTPDVASEYGEELPDWVMLIPVQDISRQQLIEMQLDKGESSAIALALEIPDSLIILDDYKARKFAQRLGLTVTGTNTRRAPRSYNPIKSQHPIPTDARSAATGMKPIATERASELSQAQYLFDGLQNMNITGRLSRIIHGIGCFGSRRSFSLINHDDQAQGGSIAAGFIPVATERQLRVPNPSLRSRWTPDKNHRQPKQITHFSSQNPPVDPAEDHAGAQLDRYRRHVELFGGQQQKFEVE